MTTTLLTAFAENFTAFQHSNFFGTVAIHTNLYNFNGTRYNNVKVPRTSRNCFILFVIMYLTYVVITATRIGTLYRFKI